MSGTGEQHNRDPGRASASRRRICSSADRPRVVRALSALAPHLSGWGHGQVDLEVSLKDTEGPDQKVTLGKRG